MKTKIKSYGDGATDFHDREVPKVGSNYNCLAVIVLRKDENYFLQVFLKECKYIEKKLVRHIIEDSEIFSDESDKE